MKTKTKQFKKPIFYCRQCHRVVNAIKDATFGTGYRCPECEDGIVYVQNWEEVNPDIFPKNPNSPRNKMKEKLKEKKCNNPQSSDEYAKDELGNIHFYCKNCGEEILKIGKGKKEKWVHGRLAGELAMIFDKI